MMKLSIVLSFICLANTLIVSVLLDDVSAKDDALESEISKSSKTEVDFSLCYDFVTLEKTSGILLRVNIPKSIPDRQRILAIKYSREPSRVFSKNGNNYAEFIFERPQRQVKVEISIRADIFRYDLAQAEMQSQKNLPKNPSLKEYLKQERMIEKEHREIKQIAEGILGQSEVAIVQNIYEYVIENMEPDISKLKGAGALKAAQTKRGKCIDYCDLFVALCRAKSIPARVVGGYKTEFSVCPKHSWAEVYLQKYGWIPFDLTFGENVPAEIRKSRFRNLKPMYIYFTNIRNDKVLHNCYTHYYGCKGGRIELEHSVIFRQPIKRIYKGP